MGNIKQSDYLFSSARVRGNEQNLLTAERIEKMVDAKDADEALKLLISCDYGDGNAEQIAPESFELLLSAEHRKLFELIRAIAPDPTVFDLFLFPYDYHNLKVLLKAEHFEQVAEPILVDTGTIPVQKMSVMVQERNFIGMTTCMREGVQEALDQVARNNDPQLIDLVLDRYAYMDIARAAKEAGHPFLQGYVSRMIDVANIKNFARVKQIGKSWDFFSKLMIGGGSLPEQLFTSNYEEALEQFSDRLESFGYGALLRDGAEALKQSGKFTRLEQLCDNYLINYMRDAKYVAYGLEPLLGYWVAKENDIKTARIILAGKLSNLAPDVLRERLRESYA